MRTPTNPAIRLLTFAAAVLSTASAGPADEHNIVEPPSRPNILFILADDLGIECLTTYGGLSHKTPHIDKLASRGMQFSHCFSNPYCSPSRSTLLTGRYPLLNGVSEVLFDPVRHADTFLDPKQPSFARQLKAAGYSTAIAGKWQLGFLNRHNYINDFGFDQYQCWQIMDDEMQRTRRFHQPHYNRNGEIVKGIDASYGPDLNAGFLMDFMKSSQAKGQPFLAYYTCLLPHFPWVPTPDSADQSYVFSHERKMGDARYFPDMVAYLDKVVGRLMDFLDEQDLTRNTIVIFVADNGTQIPLVNRWGDGEGIEVKGGKGTMTDLGTRVPLIVRWPDRIEAGSQCTDLIDFSDFLPTLCELSGAALPEEKIHGRSFAAQLMGKEGKPREWVHVQNKNNRYLRSRHYFYNAKRGLWPVIELGHAVPSPNRVTEAEALKVLSAAYDELH